jgi:hypothetical protein
VCVMQREVGVEGQGQAVAVLLLLNNLTASLGPAIMGWMDDGTTTRAQVGKHIHHHRLGRGL